MAKLTAQRLREVLHYEPESGDFVWRISPSVNVPAGARAGSLNQCGHRRIHIDGGRYQAHRLACLYMTGAFPATDVDHINGHRDDNRWANLRIVTRAVNNQNQRGPRSDNSCGRLGVNWEAGRYRARIVVDGKRLCLGRYDTADEAHTAYVAAKRRLHAGCTI